MSDIDNSLKELPNLLEELSVVRQETIKHSQLATARENLKHIFMVPETVRQTEAWIEEGKLLDAHKVKVVKLLARGLEFEPSCRCFLGIFVTVAAAFCWCQWLKIQGQLTREGLVLVAQWFVSHCWHFLGD